MTKHTAVVVCAAGIDLAEPTRKTTALYAARIGAAHVVLDVPRVCMTGPGQYKYGRFEKYQLFDVLGEYDRVLMLDADVLITSYAPNVFDLVPENAVGLVREDVSLHKAPALLGEALAEKAYAEQGLGKLAHWREGYANSGVIVASKQHRDVFRVDDWLRRKIKLGVPGQHKEQQTTNWLVARANVSVCWLPGLWNYLRQYEWEYGLPRPEAYIVHYAGRAKRGKLRAIDYIATKYEWYKAMEVVSG
ncbi:MAG: hypothetical protein WC992_05135 [Acholeplasmataceae bacterium]